MAQLVEEPIQAPATLPAAIFRHWVHAHEEDAGAVAIFRPQGFAFRRHSPATPSRCARTGASSSSTPARPTAGSAPSGTGN